MNLFILGFIATVASLDIQIDPLVLRQELSELSGDSEINLGGEIVRISERGSVKGRDLTRKYLAQKYTEMGLTTSTHSYSQNGINFIAELNSDGATQTLILSSHIDSVSNPGADDDGSGTVTVMEITRAFVALKNSGAYNQNYNIRILGFDQEEIGLVGSKAYVRFLQKEKQLKDIVANVQFEMTGYDPRSNGYFHVIDCDLTDSIFLRNSVMNAIQQYSIPLLRTDACTYASDHSSFWNEDVPAVVIANNSFGGKIIPCPDGVDCSKRPSEMNPCYHSSCDRIDMLNFDFMAKVARASALGLASILFKEKS